MLIEKLSPKPWDDSKEVIIPGNKTATLTFCAEHFIRSASCAIHDHDAFFVALSGGSTPKALFELLTSAAYKDLVQWNKCHLFWSDERAVPCDHPDSNYHMAMQSGLSKMPIPASQIHRMPAEGDIEQAALAYEKTISSVLKRHPFDLIMLGLGEDGHTASLFPSTQALNVKDRLVAANHVPQHDCWRMTFTYPCINQARHIAIYVLGGSKKKIVTEVLFAKAATYPIQQVGTPTHKALWILDEDAAEGITSRR